MANYSKWDKLDDSDDEDAANDTLERARGLSERAAALLLSSKAAEAFGASSREKLFGVQIPLALPNIFAGINQTIMMALSMVVIASMIGVQGLGVPVLRAISNQNLALGLMNGLAIVALAIIFDRVSQTYGKRLQTYREANHG